MAVYSKWTCHGVGLLAKIRVLSAGGTRSGGLFFCSWSRAGVVRFDGEKRRDGSVGGFSVAFFFLLLLGEARCLLHQARLFPSYNPDDAMLLAAPKQQANNDQQHHLPAPRSHPITLSILFSPPTFPPRKDTSMRTHPDPAAPPPSPPSPPPPNGRCVRSITTRLHVRSQSGNVM